MFRWKPSTPEPNVLPALSASGYWDESRRPLTSLVFVLPLLLIYETGVLFLGTQAIRNGVDVWLRDFLVSIGLAHYFLLPILTVSILLAWHYLSRQPWRIRGGVLYGMVGECLVLGVFLRIILAIQNQLVPPIPPILPGPEVNLLSIGGNLRELVLFIGAGIYEELLFRLILLTSAIWLLCRLGFRPRVGVVLGIVSTSVLFSAAHYIGGNAEAFQGFSFLFRFVAGIFFSILFVYRGFGIAAGTHAAYDILIGFLR